MPEGTTTSGTKPGERNGRPPDAGGSAVLPTDTPVGPPPRKARPEEKGKGAQASEEPGEATPSRFFRALMALLNVLLVGIFTGLGVLTLLMVDFLDIVQFRYMVPTSIRQRWPLAKYYDFVKLHQLPDEERYQELIFRERKRYDQMMKDGQEELEHRAHDLDLAYRGLIASQQADLPKRHKELDDEYRKRQEELRAMQEDLLKEKKLIEDLKQDLNVRKEAMDLLSRQLASEALTLESSLIRFMEDENRLKPVQNIAATMDPRSMAGILDEVSDNKMIFEILKGIPPDKSALILGFMDPEKAGKILRISQNQPQLPLSGPRSYVPPSLQNLIASTQANLR